MNASILAQLIYWVVGLSLTKGDLSVEQARGPEGVLAPAGFEVWGGLLPPRSGLLGKCARCALPPTLTSTAPPPGENLAPPPPPQISFSLTIDAFLNKTND